MIWILLTIVAIACFMGCDQPQNAVTPSPASQPAFIRVASVSPAGTDLLVGMGAADHLVGVSNFDMEGPGISGKPKIGDYQTVDWEKLAPLHPDILLMQHAQDRVTAGIERRCQDLGIHIINLQLEVIDDIYRETTTVADAIGEDKKGLDAVAALKHQLDAVRRRVDKKPRVKAVIVTGDDGLALAGPDTFLNDLLTIAGGENAANGLGKRYAAVDREKLASMAPEVVIQLMPGADRTPQVLATARRFWVTLPEIPAVKNGHVVVLTEPYGLQPGLRVGELAEKFADVLHPRTTTQPVSEASSPSPGTPGEGKSALARPGKGFTLLARGFNTPTPTTPWTNFRTYSRIPSPQPSPEVPGEGENTFTAGADFGISAP